MIRTYILSESGSDSEHEDKKENPSSADPEHLALEN